MGAEAVAELLGRSVTSVKAAANRHRISLRQKGSRRGTVLGQPRGLRLVAEMREDFVSGKVDAQLVDERIRIDREAQICPCCGIREVTVRSSGLCLCCHRDRLSSAHLQALEELDAQRAMWATRQRLHRERERRQDRYCDHPGRGEFTTVDANEVREAVALFEGRA